MKKIKNVLTIIIIPITPRLFLPRQFLCPTPLYVTHVKKRPTHFLPKYKDGHSNPPLSPPPPLHKSIEEWAEFLYQTSLCNFYGGGGKGSKYKNLHDIKTCCWQDMFFSNFMFLLQNFFVSLMFFFNLTLLAGDEIMKNCK